MSRFSLGFRFSFWLCFRRLSRLPLGFVRALTLELLAPQRMFDEPPGGTDIHSSRGGILCVNVFTFLVFVSAFLVFVTTCAALFG